MAPSEARDDGKIDRSTFFIATDFWFPNSIRPPLQRLIVWLIIPDVFSSFSGHCENHIVTGIPVKTLVASSLSGLVGRRLLKIF